ncbi:MASE3 domain-containing protein [Thermodesulfobacteriota bacterium]
MEKIYRRTNFVLFWCIILLGLFWASQYSFLLFHSLIEIFSVIVACSIFMFAWNSQGFSDNDYFLFLGIAYLFIGGLDLIHTLSYKGMAVFKGHDANLPTQLWIVARYVESISLLIAPFFMNKKINGFSIMWCYFLSVIFICILISGGLFPDCFIEGQGLTPFKKISEYLISLILIGAIVVLYGSREKFDESIYKLLIAAIIFTILAELAFTFYLSVYGFSNLIGHYFKMISFYLVYKAIIESGLQKPYDFLFLNLKKSEENLIKERNLLQDVLAELNTLRGLLPICSNCKKIRDDKGYWNQIEVYIEKHSEAQFTHGICPECAEKLYPGFKTSGSD